MYVRPIANTNRNQESRDGYMYGSELNQPKARQLILTRKLIANYTAQNPAEEEMLHDYNLLAGAVLPAQFVMDAMPQDAFLFRHDRQ